MDSSKFKVSVITPTHNDEKYISDTIESVLNQTHLNLELIIVDDASTDETVKIVESFDDKRIRLIRNTENKGAANARNIGISNATGDYIAFLDGDDLWLPQKLERQLEFMLFNHYDFTCTDYEEIDDKGNSLHSRITGPNKITHRKLLNVSYIGCLTVMYKRSVYTDLQIPEDIKKRNDYALWLKLSERVDCYFLHEILSKYRKRKSSISSGSKFKLIKYHKHVFQSLYKMSSFKAFLCAIRNVFFYVFKHARYTKIIKTKGEKIEEKANNKVLTVFFLWLNALLVTIAFLFGSRTNYSLMNAQLMSLYNSSKNESWINFKVEPTNNNVFDYEKTREICRSYYLTKNIKSYVKCDATMNLNFNEERFPINICACPVYSDTYYTEFLHLPLYRGNFSIKNHPQNGADYACYIPSSIADQILEKYGYSNYDELLNLESFYVISEAQNSYKFSINNIYLNSPESLKKHWNGQEIDDKYWETFSKNNPDTLIVYSDLAFMNAKKTTIVFDLVPNYSVMRTIIQKCFSLSEESIRCTIKKVSNDSGGKVFMKSYDFTTNSADNILKNKTQISLIVCFAVTLISEILLFLFFSDFRKKLLKPYFIFVSLFFAFILVTEILKTIFMDGILISIIFNPVGNMISYIYLLNLLIVCLVFEGTKNDKKA